MKSKKIIGLLVAVGGVVASFAAASALYIKDASPTGFGIGATYSGRQGTISYTVNGNTSGTVAPQYCTSGDNPLTDGEGLGGDYTQIKYSFTLGATFTTQTLHEQRYVVGSFSIDIKNVNSNYKDSASVWISTEGYGSGTYGEHQYQSWMTSDASLSSGSYSQSKILTVASAGVQHVDVYIKLGSEVKNGDLLAANEAKFCDVSVVWGKAENYGYAYVVGSMTSWQEDEAFAMVPNIGKAGENLEWIYNNLLVPVDSEGHDQKAKVKKGDTWSPSEDFTLDHAVTYEVTWLDDNSQPASFHTQQA